MSREELRRQLDLGEWAAAAVAQDMAGEQSGEAVAEIEPDLGHDEPLRRLLAVDCLSEVGGPSVPPLLAARLEDPDAQVRLHALKGLRRHLPGRELLGGLLKIYDRTDDGNLRETLPRVFAEAGMERGPLQRRLDDIDRASEGLIVSLARQGDPAAKVRFVELVERARGRRIAAFAELARWIGDPWTLIAFLPHFDSDELADDLSTHIEENPRRAVDVSVDLTLDLAPAGSLEVERRPTTQYPLHEVIPVKRFVLELLERLQIPLSGSPRI